MEKWIHALSQRLPLLSVFILLIFIWGSYSSTQLKKEYLPEINNPVLMITWKSPVAGENHPQQFNHDLTASLKGVAGLQSIESTLYPQGLFMSLLFSANTRIE